ncbi:MAG: T9SS type A sorting domain-containing protein [Chlorobi bacterium]|nr:T9SS type A sorting domain-containing protein [Chlorobiota bacterium]
MKRLLHLVFIVFFILPCQSHSQDFWRRVTDLGNWKIYPIGANNNVILGEKWGAKQLYRNKQPNNYWNIRGPGVTITDIEYFADGDIILGTEDGAYLSKDDGASWKQIGLNGIWISDIYIDNGIAYCACNGYVYSYDKANNKWTDWKFNWTDIPNSIIYTNKILYVGGEDETVIFWYDKPNKEWKIKGWVDDTHYDSYVMKFLEIPGKQYALTDEGLYSTAGGMDGWKPETGLQHWKKIQDIIKDPFNVVYVYDGFDVLMEVGGGAWVPMTSDGMYTTAIYGLAYDAAKSELYAAGEGVYKYNKVKDRWDFLGLSPLYIMSSLTAPDGNLYFGTSGAGVIRVKNDTAEIKNGGLNYGVIRSLATKAGNIVYAGTEGGGIYKSTDYGENWAQTDTILPGNKVRGIVIDNTDQIYAGTFGNGVFKSQGSDQSWAQVNNGLTNTFVAALTYDPGLNTLFAGTHSNGVFYSTDGGTSWQQTALDNYDVHSLAVTKAGDIFAATQTGLFRINNNSNTWNSYETIISDTTFFAININKDGVLFAGTINYGVILSYDNGNSWIEKNTGLVINNLPVRSITTFTFDSAGYAYTGTVGGGIFKSTGPVTDIAEYKPGFPKDFRLEQNYPNPFFPSTVIEYSVPAVGTGHDSFVQLKVYSTLGREVAVLVNERQKPGFYKVNFDASRLPGGFYFYRMKVGGFTQTKKMLLLK